MAKSTIALRMRGVDDTDFKTITDAITKVFPSLARLYYELWKHLNSKGLVSPAPEEKRRAMRIAQGGDL